MKIKIKVPATSANLGPGFDCLGIALNLYNELEIETADSSLSTRMTSRTNKPEITFRITGYGSKNLPADKNNLVYKTMNKVFNLTKYKLDKIKFHINLINNIPLSSGLGSSASAYILGLVAANKLCKNILSEEQILNIATELEGHPDNVVPALLGGLCISYKDQNKIRYYKIKPPDDLKAVVCIPAFQLPTKKMRKILPEKINYSDTVFNISRVGLLIGCILEKKYQLLSTAMQDKLHQPFRTKYIPCLNEIFFSAKKTGAFGVALSGSGPSVIAFCAENNAEKVGKKIQDIWSKKRIKSNYLVLQFNTSGTEI